MKIALIGIGKVGFALADNLAKLGHSILVGARDPLSKNVQAAKDRNSSFTVLSIKEAVETAEIIFLATPFNVSESALREAGHLVGKILVDCTNPIGPGLTHGLDNKLSGGEFIQTLVPEAYVVKAFTVYGFENFQVSAYPKYKEVKPAMFIAGNHIEAKKRVGGLCEELGWEVVDTGDIQMSLHLEHLTLLWIKMARVQGQGADFVWARLTR